jgi:Uma2 family endonuclease
MLSMVITTSPLVKTYTLREFWDLPEPADRSKLELIKGVLYMTPPPDYPHNKTSAKLIKCLLSEIVRLGCKGELYVPRAAIWVDENTYLEPDLMYISEELQATMDPHHPTRADIVIEIVSPSTVLYDRRTKADTYCAMGVRELWLLDPEAKGVEVRSFESGTATVFNAGEALRSRVLAHVEIPVDSLFAA